MVGRVNLQVTDFHMIENLFPPDVVKQPMLLRNAGRLISNRLLEQGIAVDAVS
jgi:hypothetical protein